MDEENFDWDANFPLASPQDQEPKSEWDAFPLADQASTPGALLAEMTNRFRNAPTDSLLGQRTAFVDRAYWTAERVPLAGGVFGVTKSAMVASAANRIKGGKATTDDYVLVGHYLASQEKQEGRSTGGKIFDLVTQIPGFAVEFAASGGLASGAKVAAGEAAERAMGSAAKGIAGRVAKGAAEQAADIAGRAAMAPSAIAGNTAEQMMPAVTPQVAPSGNWVQATVGDDRSFLEALPRGAALGVIDVVTEKTGAGLAKIPGAMAAIPVPQAVAPFKDAVAKAWVAIKPGRSLEEWNKKLAATGWNGMLAELGEERVGEALRLASGLGDGGVIERTAAGEHGEAAEQLGVEAAAFGLFGAGANLAGRAIAPRQPEAQQPDAELRQRMDQIQADYVAREKAKRDAKTAQSQQPKPPETQAPPPPVDANPAQLPTTSEESPQPPADPLSARIGRLSDADLGARLAELDAELDSLDLDDVRYDAADIERQFVDREIKKRAGRDIFATVAKPGTIPAGGSTDGSIPKRGGDPSEGQQKEGRQGREGLLEPSTTAALDQGDSLGPSAPSGAGSPFSPDGVSVATEEAAGVPGSQAIEQPAADPAAVPGAQARDTAGAGPQEEAAPRRGQIGDMLESGQVVTTATGRPTTPFPKIKPGKIGISKTVKNVNQWLIDNAIAEAKSRGDEFNLLQFQNEKADNLPPASKDSMEQYLFGDEQPPVLPSLLKQPTTDSLKTVGQESVGSPPAAEAPNLATVAQTPVQEAASSDEVAGKRGDEKTSSPADVPVNLSIPEPPKVSSRRGVSGEAASHFQEYLDRNLKERSDLEDQLNALRKEMNGLRSNAVRKRQAIREKIAAVEQKMRPIEKEISNQQRKLSLGKLEAIQENPPTPEHGWAAAARIADLLADDAAEKRDWSERDEYRKEYEAATLKLVPSAEAAARRAGLTDQQEAGMAAATAVDRFAAMPWEYATIDDAVKVGVEAVRRNRYSGGEFAEFDRAAQAAGSPYYNRISGGPYSDLNSAQLEDVRKQLQEAVKDDANWRARTAAIFAAAKKQSEELAGQREAAAKAKREQEEKERVELEAEAAKANRERAKSQAREALYWKSVKQRAKEIKGRKTKFTLPLSRGKDQPTDEVDVDVEYLSDLWAIAEIPEYDEENGWVKPKLAGKSKTFSLTHMPSKLFATSASTPQAIKELWVHAEDAGVDWDAVKTANDGGGDVGKQIRKSIKAWDAGNLYHHDDDAVKAALLAKAPQSEALPFESDLTLGAVELGLGSKMHSAPILERIKEFAGAVPEFRYNPVLTVDAKKNLVFRDGYKFTFPPEQFNLAAGELTTGQTVGINLPELGIRLATEQDVVAEMLESQGFSNVRKPANGTVVAAWKGKKVEASQLGKEKWDAAGVGEEAVKRAKDTLHRIRWQQPSDPNAGPSKGKAGPSLGSMTLADSTRDKSLAQNRPAPKGPSSWQEDEAARWEKTGLLQDPAVLAALQEYEKKKPPVQKSADWESLVKAVAATGNKELAARDLYEFWNRNQNLATVTQSGKGKKPKKAGPGEPTQALAGPYTTKNVPINTGPVSTAARKVSARDIVATMARDFDVTLKYGRVPPPSEGVYKVWSEVVRVRDSEAASLAVESHEIAHDIDKQTEVISEAVGGIDRPNWSRLIQRAEQQSNRLKKPATKQRSLDRWADKLTKAGAPAAVSDAVKRGDFPGARREVNNTLGVATQGQLTRAAELAALDYVPGRDDITEGWAEFVRHYLTRDDAQAKAPSMLKWLLDDWLPKHRKYDKAFRHAKSLIDSYRGMTAEERATQNKAEPGSQAEALDVPAGEQVREFAGTMLDKFQFEWSDRNHFFKLMERAAEAAGLVRGALDNTIVEVARWVDGSIFNHTKGALLGDGVRTIASGRVRKLAPPLIDVVAPIRDGGYDHEEWDDYHYARHVLEVRDIADGKGVPRANMGMRYEDAEAIVDRVKADPKKHAAFEKTSTGFSAFRDAILDMRADAGEITQELADKLKRYYGKHASARRVKPSSIVQRLFGRGGGALNVGGWVRRRSAKGSGYPRMHQLDAVTMDLAEGYHNAMFHVLKAKILGTVVKNAKYGFNGVEGLGHWAEIVDPKMKPQSFQLDDVLTQMVQKNIIEQEDADLFRAVDRLRNGQVTKKDGDVMFQKYGTRDPAALRAMTQDVPTLEEVLTVFRPDYRPDGRDYIERIMVNGEPVLVQWNPDVYETFMAMGPMQLNALERSLAGIADLQRLGATGLNAVFASRQLPADYFTGVFQAKEQGPVESLWRPFHSVGKIVYGMWNQLQRGKQTPSMKMMEENYGSLFDEYQPDRAGAHYLRNKLFVKGALPQALETMKNPAVWLRSVNNLIRQTGSKLAMFDLPARLAEGTALLKKHGYVEKWDAAQKDWRWWHEPSKKFEEPPIELQRKFLSAVADATVSFRTAGRSGRYVNRVLFPYFNPALQGMLVMARRVKAALSGDRRAQAGFLIGAAATGAMTVMARAIAEADNPDELEEREQWYKSSFWATDDVMLRKPQSWAWVPNTIEALLSMLAGDEDAIADYARQEIEQQSYFEIPGLDDDPIWGNAAKLSGLGPVIEAGINRDTFRDRKIEGTYLEGLPAKDRSDARTSEAAKAVGSVTGPLLDLGPKKVEHLAERMTGGLLTRSPLKNPFAAHDTSESRRELDGRRDELEAKKKAARIHGTPWTPKDEAEYDRVDAADLIVSKFYKLMDGKGKAEQDRLQKWITGTARYGLGRPPLESYPDPYRRFSSAPPEIKAEVTRQVLANVTRAVDRAANPLTKKEQQEGKTLSGKVAEWKASREAALSWLKNAGLDKETVLEIVRADARDRLKMPDSRIARIQAFRAAMGW